MCLATGFSGPAKTLGDARQKLYIPWGHLRQRLYAPRRSESFCRYGNQDGSAASISADEPLYASHRARAHDPSQTPEDDGVRWFNRMYLMITKQVRDDLWAIRRARLIMA
jgi:hypothetical protein